MATPKIWLMGPDPSKQCCACGSKTGPCDSCSSCLGEKYNVDFAKWYFDTQFLSGVVPAHCEVAQSAADSNSIGDKTISLSIANTGPARSNAFTNHFPKVSGGANGSYAITTKTTVSPFAATYDGATLSFPSLNTGHQLVMYGTPSASVWATGLSTDFNSVTNAFGTPLAIPGPFGGAGTILSNTGGLSIFPFPTHVYPRNSSNGSGLQPWSVGTFFDGGGTFFTPYAVGGIQALRVNGSAYNTGPNDINVTGGTGLFYPDVGATAQTFSAGIGSRSWRCDNTAGQFSWDALAGPFGNLSILPAAQSAYESMISAFVAGPPITGQPSDGNRILGYEVQLVGEPGYQADPQSVGIGCNGGNVGQIVEYGGGLVFYLYTSTKWPFQGFSTTVSNSLAIQTNANVDSCITMIASGGGVGFDGIKSTAKSVTFSYAQDQSLSISPLIFITGASKANNGGAQAVCPYSLP